MQINKTQSPFNLRLETSLTRRNPDRPRTPQTAKTVNDLPYDSIFEICCFVPAPELLGKVVLANRLFARVLTDNVTKRAIAQDQIQSISTNINEFEEIASNDLEAVAFAMCPSKVPDALFYGGA